MNVVFYRCKFSNLFYSNIISFDAAVSPEFPPGHQYYLTYLNVHYTDKTFRINFSWEKWP